MSDQYPSRVAEKIVIRLPDGMRARLAALARENKRSVNAEVVARLESSLAGQETAAPKFEALQAAVETLKMLVDNRRELEDAFDREGIPLPWPRD